MAGKKNKKKRNVKVRKVKRHAKPSNGFHLIERIWAELGIIRVITKDGDHRTYTTSEAANLASAINQMQMPPWHAKHKNAFVEKIVSVIREAKHQQENKNSAKTQGIMNVLQGKTAEGKEMPKVNDEDTQVQMLMFKYPLLEEADIRAILRDTRLDKGRKLMFMEAVNTQRFSETGINPKSF